MLGNEKAWQVSNVFFVLLLFFGVEAYAQQIRMMGQPANQNGSGASVLGAGTSNPSVQVGDTISIFIRLDGSSVTFPGLSAYDLNLQIIPQVGSVGSLNCIDYTVDVANSEYPFVSSLPNASCGALSGGALNIHPLDPDVDYDAYLAEIVLEAGAGSVGDFRVTYDPAQLNAISGVTVISLLGNPGNWEDLMVTIRPPGGCCLPAFACSVETQSDCAVLGGLYQGDGTDCPPSGPPCICSVDPDCDDGEFCTTDTCDPLDPLASTITGCVFDSTPQEGLVCVHPSTGPATCESGSCVLEVAPPGVVSDIASRFIEVMPDLSYPLPFALRVTNLCAPTDNVGWVSLRDVDYDDGPTGDINVGVTTPNCADADFLLGADWVSSVTGRLVVTGTVILPQTRFEVVAVAPDCAGQVLSLPASTLSCTWQYADVDGSGDLSFGGDLQKVFDNTPSVSGVLGWLASAPGYEVDVQGDEPIAVPDGAIGFGTDLQAVSQALPAFGGALFAGPTCPLSCP
jgi:hypothetical protein